MLVKLLLCTGLISLSFFAIGQTYFNLRQDFFQSWGDYSWSVHADSDYIWVTFGTYYNGGLSGPSGGGLVKLDQSGGVIDTTFISVMDHNVFMGGPGNLNPLNDGFILGGSLQDSLGNADVMMMRFDVSGNTIWTRTYGDTSFQSGWMARPTTDGGFLLCGQSATDSWRGDALLMKTDSLGNLLWWRTYGDSIRGELAFAFTETSDGGYALVGETIFGSRNFWVAKLDSGGNLQWDTIFTVTSGQHYGRAWSVVSTQDGNIVIAGFLSLALQSVQSYFMKMDLSGNLLWAKQYFNDYADSEVHSIRELSDGSLIATGFHNNPQASVRHKGFLIKLSSNGDSLWSQEYYREPNSSHRLEDVYPTPDGGFVACGVIFIQSPDTGNQDLWIIKVDSMGCEIANCTIGIDKLARELNPLAVYPIPFGSYFIAENKLSKSVGLLQVFNATGKLIEERKFHSIQEYFDTTHWPEGIYLIRLLCDGKIFNANVVKVND